VFQDTVLVEASDVKSTREPGSRGPEELVNVIGFWSDSLDGKWSTGCCSFNRRGGSSSPNALGLDIVPSVRSSSVLGDASSNGTLAQHSGYRHRPAAVMVIPSPHGV